jgi:hypothetical protein
MTPVIGSLKNKERKLHDAYYGDETDSDPDATNIVTSSPRFRLNRIER